MSKSSILMMANSQGKWELVGEPVRADGWYGMTDGLHTVSATLVGFVGSIVIEAAITTEPREDDWFVVNCNKNQEPLNFTLSSTGTYGFNVTGSFVWLRARLKRSHLGVEPSQEQLEGYGYVDRILINI